MTAIHTLLISTVGGSPEPIAAALKHWQPARVLFVPSAQTRKQVEEGILPLAAASPNGFSLGPGAIDVVPVADAQDFAGCVVAMSALAEEVRKWLGRGDDYGVVVDFTGGTKCMSAALALLAHPWGCRFSYVGGTDRTKDSVGIVVSGKEQVLHAENPWAVLGFRAAADAITLFDQADYAASARLLEAALRVVQDPARRRELGSLKSLADAYDAWDRFDHASAARLLGDVGKNANDLRSLFGAARADELRCLGERHRALLAALTGLKTPTWALFADLLANARRRGGQGRFDDAVARLYRAIEAAAQARLAEAHAVADTGKVPLDQLPIALRGEKSAAAKNGCVALALQDDYQFLLEQGDHLGQKFQALGLADREKSPLVARNQSILAHGFAPVGEKIYQRLAAATLELGHVGGIDEAQLTVFPRLG